MTDKEKLKEIKKLADSMYYAAQYLTTDASRLHKAMEDYHQFFINEYHKEEPTIPDIVDEHFYEMLGEEPVSEGLQEAAKEWLRPQLDKSYANYGEVKMMELTHFDGYAMLDAIEFGAKWQKEHLWKPADGDDLPEYDREVIAILDYDFGHYKVVYAHRPNPNGWNGTNIDTGEKEHFEPVIYDKGGWNQPHILYWLDTRLPYEENKIIKEL